MSSTGNATSETTAITTTAPASSSAAPKSKKNVPQPPWIQPTITTGPSNTLMVRNSLACDRLVPFGASQGRIVSWYSCGPTVYDSSHLGHARNYITIDVIRRIMEDYFGYSIFAVMNVTDIDDKIILKSRRNHLISEFIKTHPKVTTAEVTLMIDSWKLYIAGIEQKKTKLQANIDKNLKVEESKATIVLLDKDVVVAKEAIATLQTLNEPLPPIEVLLSPKQAYDALGQVLDSTLGASVPNMRELCQKHASKYEAEFMEDMTQLGIIQPDVISRVTEYVDKVIKFIQKIIDNKFAYEENESIYFDTVAFSAHPDHFYARLEPWSVGDQEKTDDGDGALSAAKSEKHNKNDFALWKKSKEGEPWWESPWGHGRPGWHIECSAMASDLIGPTLDVHMGGEDLKFPHHDNELAQSEAYFGNKQWVNYFFHCGHLHINGLKMSKSLKNFITIREALVKYTPRQLRFMVLSQQWDATMNFSDAAMELVKKKEKQFQEFFHAVNNMCRDGYGVTREQTWGVAERALHAAFVDMQNKVHADLLNNFNTPDAISHMLDVVHKANDYINPTNSRPLIVHTIARYIARILRVFGINGLGNDLFEKEREISSTSSGEAAIAPILDVLAEFRKNVRQRGCALKDESLLNMTDSLRDEVLPKLGVRIEDAAKFPWKIETPEEVMRSIRERKAQELSVELKKLNSRKTMLEKELEQLDSWSTPLSELFPATEYKAPPPGEAVPTHDAAGVLLPKSRRSKLQKLYDSKKKGHDKWVEETTKDPQFVEKKKQLLSDTTARIAQINALMASASPAPKSSS
ncbi:cysteine-tRNA ligase [Pelomyxa schiedti]|nr:cysteine-tRNA ligase [Pelomyxa schiedti]